MIFTTGMKWSFPPSVSNCYWWLVEGTAKHPGADSMENLSNEKPKSQDDVAVKHSLRVAVTQRWLDGTDTEEDDDLTCCDGGGTGNNHLEQKRRPVYLNWISILEAHFVLLVQLQRAVHITTPVPIVSHCGWIEIYYRIDSRQIDCFISNLFRKHNLGEEMRILMDQGRAAVSETKLILRWAAARSNQSLISIWYN